MPSSKRAHDPVGIAQRILVLRGQRVLLDADLAALYGVSPKRLNEQVRRNRARFPEDFAFHPEIKELHDRRSQIATASSKYRNLRFPPLAFTEHGARKLEALEKSVATLDARTRKQFEDVYTAIRALMAPPTVKARRIGFTADLDEN